MTTLECRLLNASIACYAIKHGALDPSNPNLDKVRLQPGAPVTVFVEGTEDINAGFVCETADNWVVIALRGTLPPFKGDFLAWIDDWLQDFKAGPTPWYVGGRKFGHVETGFADAVNGVMPQIWAALSKIDLHGKRGILVTGHSKGAAMTYLVTSLVKTAHPTMLVENCCFASPMTCDREFQTNYDALGLRPFTVRYQNMYDIVPYLPYWPTFSLLSALERRIKSEHEGVHPVNEIITEAHWPRTDIENEYVDIGILRYLGPDCVVEYGAKGAHDAWQAMKHALDHFEFKTIAEAHASAGRYDTCVCGS